MSARDPDEEARRLAAESLDADDPTGWFERLYTAAAHGEADVPWDRGAPHRLLVEWARARGLDGSGRRALVVGCGLGEDAEYVAGLGFDTLAFDIAPTAVRAARDRFPGSPVRYLTADLLDPPAEWRQAFDLVVESLTVQALPRTLRPAATARVAGMVAPGGTLLVIAAAREEQDGRADGPPWPLTRAEVEAFAASGLRTVRIEDIRDAAAPGVRRWRAEFTLLP
ncbi:class I SAM-dependent methyltransferase [Streptomyces sp. NPDC059373]